MELQMFTTPSGYTVYLKPYLTFRQKRELDRFLASKMMVDPINQTKKTEIPASIYYDTQDLLLKFLIEKVTDTQNVTYTGDAAIERILSMKEEDGKMVFDKIDELTQAKTLSDDAKKN